MTTYSQTPMPISRSFNAWRLELEKRKAAVKAQFDLDVENARMFYNGGYSPKMVVHEILHVPPEIDLFS